LNVAPWLAFDTSDPFDPEAFALPALDFTGDFPWDLPAFAAVGCGFFLFKRAPQNSSLRNFKHGERRVLLQNARVQHR
jgi:hypothetical protein